MLRLTAEQMGAGSSGVRARFVATVAASIHRRYGLPDDDALRMFVEKRRATALALGFRTGRQVADLVEACLPTSDAVLDDPAFRATMRRPLMDEEWKAEIMFRRHVWPDPRWMPEHDGEPA